MLTRKEKEILLLLAEGLNNTEIADKLHNSATTIKNHVSHMLKKTDCYDRIGLIVKYYKGELK